MNILLTNDDGYLATGFLLLCQKLSLKHNVYVVAPDSQRSATSHASLFYKDIRFVELDAFCGAKRAFISSGGPSNCVKYGLTMLGETMDLVISGPNDGDNYAINVLYSGTIGGAEEAVVNSVRAIALSRLGYGIPFASCVEYLCNNLDELCTLPIGENTFININVPCLPLSEMKGVKVAKLGGRLYDDHYVTGNREGCYQLVGDQLPIEHMFVGSDVYFATKGYVTLTPITIDQTDYEKMSLLEKFEK